MAPAQSKVSEGTDMLKALSSNFHIPAPSWKQNETEHRESFCQYQCLKFAEKAVGAIVVKSLASELCSLGVNPDSLPPSLSTLFFNSQLIKSL